MLESFTLVVNSLLPEPQASLLNGILFGTKASMPKAFYNALVVTGTLHIIALSGVNIAIMITLLGRLTERLGRKISLFATICLIAFFVWLTGASPSVVRAALMGSMSLLAVYFGRQNWGLLSLFLTAGIMLLVDFSLINNLSFQLSFFATLGIILAGGRVKRQKGNGFLGQIKYWFIQNLRLTFSAQLFTVPIIIYHFHRISLVAPLTNILIEWVIQPIMVLGLITVVMGYIWLPLGFIFAWGAWVPLTYLITVIELLAKIPGASIKL